MKHKLLGILVASICTVPVLAIANPPAASPTSSSTSSAVGGSGGSGGNAAGGMATGGNATNTISGTSANGNTSTVNLSVSVPASGSSGSSGSSGATTAAATPTAVGDPGSSPFNTKGTIEYSGSYSVKTAPPITAPSLTTTLSDTCMGSVSFGLSFTGFGATGASTMVDQACVRRLDAREFRAMGLNDVALALLCQSDANRKAVEATGHDCPGMARPAVATNTVVQKNASNAASASGNVSVGSVSDSDSTELRDPYVRRRLGLAPLSEETASK
jgi:hypothetical protein